MNPADFMLLLLALVVGSAIGSVFYHAHRAQGAHARYTRCPECQAICEYEALDDVPHSLIRRNTK